MRSLRRDLFERRLWPLAVVIIAAIVALPFLQHGHRASAAFAPPPPADGAPTTTTTTSPAKRPVAPTTRHSTTPTSRTRDPFQEAGVSPTSAPASPSTSPSATTRIARTPSTPASSAGSGASPSQPVSSTSTPSPTTSSAVTSTPVVTHPVTTTRTPTKRTAPRKAPAKQRPARHAKHPATRSAGWGVYSVDLRIGTPGATVMHRNIARLTPLPRERSPQVMYMGVADHGRGAVFALGAGVEVRGLGARRSAGVLCHPSRADCALILVPAGRSVELLYVSSTGRSRPLLLRLTRVRSRITRSRSAVRAARRHVSRIGLCDLKLGDPIGFFDPTADSVTIPSIRACRRHRLAVPFPGSLGAGSSVRG